MNEYKYEFKGYDFIIVVDGVLTLRPIPSIKEHTPKELNLYTQALQLYNAQVQKITNALEARDSNGIS